MSDNPYETTSYGYVPSISYGAIFITVFGLTLLAHTAQIVVSRKMYFMVCMSLGCLGEVIGWIFRLISHSQPANRNAYIGQISVLIISPTFFSAALYWALGVIIQLVAPRHSIISAKWFKILFVVADFISLVVQGIGGGMAGSAETDDQLDLGSNIMLGGIVFQLIVMIVYVAYGIYWSLKAKEEVARSGKKMRYMLYALFAASLCIIARGIFRTVELAEGFDGFLAVHEQYILIDAIPIAACSFILNLVHPAWFLKVEDHEKLGSSGTFGAYREGSPESTTIAMEKVGA
ncbi:RTA1 domain-containing protein [Sporobolomyces salmoneus]|uniref:RTA1 domain-containing protein n=1 Tax=Sporobolomyces salmoneus TaxID=183962 RepID=UPI00316BE6C2